MENKRKSLQWFIDFINCDLSRLSDNDKWKLAIDISSLTTPKRSLDFSAPSKDVRPGIAEIIGPRLAQNIPLAEIHRRVKDFFDFFMMSVERYRLQEGKWLNQEDFDYFQSLGGLSVALEVQVDAACKIDQEQKGKMLRARYAPGSIGNGIVSLVFESDNRPDLVTFHFARIVEGFPLSTFCVCPECTKYFVHFNKHERDFCSNLCASRHGVRERRKKIKDNEPDRYNRESQNNAERVHAAYEKKIHANHPKAKVKRIPRKHKPKK